jgi:hypothetical protein
MSEEPMLVMSPLATVLRDAFDSYWELNPPTHQQGTEGYYDWYKGQNEYVAAKVAEHAIHEHCLTDAQFEVRKDRLKAHLLFLRNWFMECESLSDDEVQYQVQCINELLAEIGEGV